MQDLTNLGQQGYAHQQQQLAQAQMIARQNAIHSVAGASGSGSGGIGALAHKKKSKVIGMTFSHQPEYNTEPHDTSSLHDLHRRHKCFPDIHNISVLHTLTNIT